MLFWISFLLIPDFPHTLYERSHNFPNRFPSISRVFIWTSRKQKVLNTPLGERDGIDKHLCRLVVATATCLMSLHMGKRDACGSIDREVVCTFHSNWIPQPSTNNLRQKGRNISSYLKFNVSIKGVTLAIVKRMGRYSRKILTQQGHTRNILLNFWHSLVFRKQIATRTTISVTTGTEPRI